MILPDSEIIQEMKAGHEDIKAEVSVHEKASQDFLEDAGDCLRPPVVLSADQERRLYRKIDLRLIPILTLLQLLSFMDRGTYDPDDTSMISNHLYGAWQAISASIQIYAPAAFRLTLSTGNAKLQGLTTQLDLSGNRYSAALVSTTS